MNDIVRVFRVIEYVGPRDWVEKTISNSIKGTMPCGEHCKISAVTIGEWPEQLAIDENKTPYDTTGEIETLPPKRKESE